MNFAVPVDPKSTTIEAKDAGKPKTLHAASVTLVSLTGNSAKLHYRGASEHLLLVRGYGADGKLLAVDSRQILPQKQDVDQDFTITFKGPVAKVEFEVAAKIIERVFPLRASGAAAQPAAAARSSARRSHRRPWSPRTCSSQPQRPWLCPRRSPWRRQACARPRAERVQAVARAAACRRAVAQARSRIIAFSGEKSMQRMHDGGGACCTRRKSCPRRRSSRSRRTTTSRSTRAGVRQRRARMPRRTRCR